MSNVYFISDLHFNHKNILNFAGDYREGSSSEEHDHILIAKWNTLINKKDLVYVLGDIVMGKPDNLDILSELNGRKILIRGNHDDRFSTKEYLEHFEEVYGILKYKGYWLTHCPMHPAELRGKKNIHGHVHHNTIRDYHHEPDKRYINVCVEACNGFPVRAKDVFEGTYKQLC
jgi:calcineurin-like phosphoesterase family protein